MLQAEFPFVGDVRGLGYMWGLEFVADPGTAVPPDPALDVTAKAVAAAAASRLIVYPARFCADGTRGDAVLIGPPLTATDEELDELLTRLRATLATLAPLFPGAWPGRSGRPHPATTPVSLAPPDNSKKLSCRGRWSTRRGTAAAGRGSARCPPRRPSAGSGIVKVTATSG